jgi:hypothetical protein
MKHLLLFFALFLCLEAIGQDSLTIATKKVEAMVQDVKKKELLEQKLSLSEQQVRSFMRLDSLYIDLRVDLMSTVNSQQESIKDLVKINQGSSLLMSGIKEELKDVRLNFYNDNIKLRSDNEELRNKNNNKTKIIVGLSAVLATIVTVIAL